MSLSAFLQQYVKPSRWWRRQRTIQITVWPKFLAQALCPHENKQMIMWDVATKLKTSLCIDCYKHIEETNDCAHGEVSIHAVETINLSNAPAPFGGRRSAQLIPRSYLCEHCGVELETKDLPHGVRVVQNDLGKLL
jgi:hypothetical protein